MEPIFSLISLKLLIIVWDNIGYQFKTNLFLATSLVRRYKLSEICEIIISSKDLSLYITRPSIYVHGELPYYQCQAMFTWLESTGKFAHKWKLSNLQKGLSLKLAKRNKGQATGSPRSRTYKSLPRLDCGHLPINSCHLRRICQLWCFN